MNLSKIIKANMDIVKENTIKMLHLRGYTKITEDEPEYIKMTTDDESIMVFFVEHTKVKIDIVKMIISKAKFMYNVIIVHAKSLTPDAKYTLSFNKLFHFETFTFDEMMYDPIEIVPTHKLFEGNIKDVIKLPIILLSDIIVRYFDFKKGSIIEINDEGYISYRRVV
jgi:DNA-directed RNA polymerase subunit H (RpoH/RPB5)